MKFSVTELFGISEQLKMSFGKLAVFTKDVKRLLEKVPFLLKTK